MNIVLINPSSLSKSGRDLYSAHLLGPLYTFSPFTKMGLGVPLALPTIAAHTPEHHHLKIVDEEIENIDFLQKPDLVGITAMSYKASRAYEISKEFRKRNVPVVMGGIHASMCPEEALKHVDSVVIGEAEEVWPKVLEDFERGDLKAEYRSDHFPDLSKVKSPRYDLVKNDHYLFSYLQTARGCPYDCSFCTVTIYNGKKVRKKSPEQTIKEVEALFKNDMRKIPDVIDLSDGKKKNFSGLIGFIDDNFAIDRNHALAVCEALSEYQKKHNKVILWYTQVNYTVGFDAELLKAMADANCFLLFIGFESLDPRTLARMNKKHNTPGKYAESIKNIHSHGMRLVYSTIIGDENTSIESINQLVSFLESNKVFHVLPNILTPFPGSRIRQDMEQTGRILISEPKYYNLRNVVYKPSNMTPFELQIHYTQLCQRILGYSSLQRRARDMLARQEKLIFPFKIRVISAFGIVITSSLLWLQKKMRSKIFLKLALHAPFTFLPRVGFTPLEVFSSAVDYDDFAFKESIRLENAKKLGNEYTDDRFINKVYIHDIIKDKIESDQLNIDGRAIKYKHYFVTQDLCKEMGIKIEREAKKRPLLILLGTSFDFSDAIGLTIYLIENGFSVGSIENSHGNPLDWQLNPKVDRVAVLKDFLSYLKSKDVDEIDIVAQSYSAFEVFRLLSEQPSEYKDMIKNIILVNPPGFTNKLTLLTHCRRFFIGHVFKAYVQRLRDFVGLQAYRFELSENQKKTYLKRDTFYTSVWLRKTFRNVFRSSKELLDIIGFKLLPGLKVLANDRRDSFYLFLSEDDDLIMMEETIKNTENIIPMSNIITAPGRHNDLMTQDLQRENFFKIFES